MARSSVVCSLLLLAFLAGTASAITCGQVDSDLSSCLGYARKGGVIPPGCCAGVRTLNNLAKTTPDRQTACNCLKSLVNPSLGLNAAIVAGIPAKCGVNIPYPISMQTDCNKVR
uniref:Non-specific lipid-transfer protein n=1 Tax=Lilium hybrid cultivar TaxID=156531 RepID=H9BEW9_9LILI|nr:stigma/style cysteine-rich adhesin [Lilium hybrid cultivar]